MIGVSRSETQFPFGSTPASHRNLAMDSEFEPTDQPVVAQRDRNRRPVPTALVVLLTLACLATAPVGFFTACTAGIFVVPALVPDGNDNTGFSLVLGCALVGAVVVPAVMFLLLVWPLWRRWLALRAEARASQNG